MINLLFGGKIESVQVKELRQELMLTPEEIESFRKTFKMDGDLNNSKLHKLDIRLALEKVSKRKEED